MTDTLTPTTALSRLDERSLSLVRYWDGLRNGRPVPDRVEINPTDITRHLSRICILERPRAGTVRIRLTGALLSERMGMELRGMPFRSLFELDDRAVAMNAAETAMVTPSISFLSLDRQDRLGTHREGLLAILPLADTRGALTRAIALYSEAAGMTSDVAQFRGRFRVADSWSLDIPEKTNLPGLNFARAAGTLTKREPVRLRQVAQRKVPALPRIEARQMEHHARPVFQVIDGGLA